MPAASTVEIRCVLLDGTHIDLTPYVMFQSARFDSQANAVPGTFEFTVKDPNQELEFASVTNGYTGIITGSEIYLFIDGEKLWGGLLLHVDRAYAFDVVDTSDPESVTARQFVLSGADFNTWFDKRVIRDTADYTRVIRVQGIHYDGELVRQYVPDYIDVPPGVTFPAGRIDDIERFGIKYEEDRVTVDKVTGVRLPTQGDPWRSAMEKFAWRSAAVWYIDAEKRVNFRSLENSLSSFNFTDHDPGGNRIGCRAVRATENGDQLVTDALVWGGLEELASNEEDDPSGVFFARYPGETMEDGGPDDSPAVTEAKWEQAIANQERYGIWQYAEANFEQGDDPLSVFHRARSIVTGPPGVAGGMESGLNRPIWDIGLTWFAHDVPGSDHIHPGEIATIFLYVMGHERADGTWIPLVQTLPLRSMTISFPQIPAVNEGQFKTWVQFEGQFGLSFSDSRILWRFLLRAESRRRTAGDWQAAGLVTETSLAAGYNAPGRFDLTPDGSTTTFVIERAGPTSVPFLAGTTRVYINGLVQRPGFEYTEDPDDGTITFVTAPLADDIVHIELRTAEG